MNEICYKISFYSRLKSLWSGIVDAIRGTEQDYTKINLKKAIFLLSIPMVLEMCMESVFAIVDIYFVSSLGADAVASVGLTESLMSILYALAFGIATSATAIVSRRIGEQDPKSASESALQAIIIGIFISIIIAIIGLVYTDKLYILMGANESVIQNYSGYMRIMFAGNISIMLLFIINAIFRSAGDAAISLRVLFIGNAINIVLDPCLIYGWGPFPKLGVEGAAIATVTGRLTAVIYQIYLLLKGNYRIKIILSQFKIDFGIILNIIKMSLGATGQNIIATSSWVLLMRIVSEFGSTAIAGYTIAIRIIIFFLLPSVGMANAASTLVGQNLGAKRPDRAESSVWITGSLNSILLGCIGIILIVIPQYWLSLFISEPDVIAQGAISLQIVSFGFISYGLGMVLLHAINGAGDTITPVKLNIIFFWLVEVPLAYALSISADMNLNGVCYAIIAAETLLTLAAVLVFKRGKWKSSIV